MCPIIEMLKRVMSPNLCSALKRTQYGWYDIASAIDFANQTRKKYYGICPPLQKFLNGLRRWRRQP